MSNGKVILKRLTNQDETVEGWVFQCPGCKTEHFYDSRRWTFNGNFEKPSFSPSLLHYKTDFHIRCHLWITDGIIKFFDDCEHDLKGQSVPMVELEDW